jgi:protein gp37
VSDQSGIEWTDATWNPITGCTEVSPGCDHCYAKTFAERWRGTPGHYFEHGFDVQLRPDKLTLPLRWRKPRKVFVNSMSDLFHKDVPDHFIAQVFAVMAATPQHTYQVLTKRHGRMRSLLANANRNGLQDMIGVEYLSLDGPSNVIQWPLPNVWLGVSVEDQQRADLRIPALLDTPAAVRWLSCEPLIGPVNLRAAWAPSKPGPHSVDDMAGMLRWDDHTRIDWVVVGGESGHGVRPMHPEWARSLRDQCVAADVPFLFKQWGGRTPKANGRELDGRTWDQYPEVAA